MTELTVKVDVEGNWEKFLQLVEGTIDLGSGYRTMLEQLGPDQKDEKHLLGFKRAPAAKGNHHAFEGGLVYHLLEMWDIWNVLWENGPGIYGDAQHLTDSRVLKGIINHDLHKGWRTYELLSEDPWSTRYAEDLSDKLTGKNPRAPTGAHKNLFILQKHGIVLDLEDMNVILNAEGGWSETQTYWITVTAKLIYLLDELSGNVIGRISSQKWLGHNQQV